MSKVKSAQLNDEELEALKLRLNKGMVPVGIDLAARIFQVCYANPDTYKIKNSAFNREEFIEFIKNPPFPQPMLAGFEACGACNFWARFIAAAGHSSKILFASDVSKNRGQDKSDKIDALAIFKTLINPSVRTVNPRSEENQLLNNLFSVRELLVKQQTQTANAHRALLYEVGVVCREGLAPIQKANAEFIQELEQKQSASLSNFNACAAAFATVEKALTDAAAAVDNYLTEYSQSNATCRNLATIPGIGSISAVALYALMDNPDNFPDSRHYAAYVGFCPTNTGSGGKLQSGYQRKTGNKIVKKILYMCAVARFSLNQRTDKERTSKLSSLIDNEAIPNKRILCTIANRMARVAWSIAKSGKPYDKEKCRLLG